MSKTYDIKYKVHLFSIILVVVGLSYSKIFMSMGTFIMFINWLISKDLKSKWSLLFTNKIFILAFALYLFHVVGLLWTTNFDFGLHDLKQKLTLPLLLIPLLSTEIFEKDKKIVESLFIAGVVSSSIINFSVYHHWIGNKEVNDIREMSLFGSHIRFSMMIVLAIVITMEHLRNVSRSSIKALLLVVIFWLLIYTYYSQVLTGYLSIIGCVLVYLFAKKYPFKKGIIISIIGLIGLMSFYTFNFLEEKEAYIDPSGNHQFTKEGNPYIKDTIFSKYISISSKCIKVCDKELKREWEKQSKLDYFGKDKTDQLLRITLIRYLNSRNLSKDALGFSHLSKKEIQAIENGVASYHETIGGIYSRFYGLKFQIQNNKDPNGHSILERLEYWQTGLLILKENWILGVGTGDIEDAFKKKYQETNSLLKEENRLRTHNMYLSFWISLGTIGFITFSLLIYFIFRHFMDSIHLIGLCFITIFVLSFFIEDTLETQLGITFFSVFLGLYGRNKKLPL